tara:strand:+ start:7842 stop:8468 length:627 start_codon:yes stop_codon:yes gene_type:complete
MKCPRSSFYGKDECDGGIWCLDCVRKWCDLNKPKKERQNKPIRCGKCRAYIMDSKYAYASKCYQVLDALFPEIDKYTKDIAICRRSSCGVNCNTQRKLWKHIKNECEESMMKCEKCTRWIKRKDMKNHIECDHTYVECSLCQNDHGFKNKILKKKLISHFNWHRQNYKEKFIDSLNLMKIEHLRLKKIEDSINIVDNYLSHIGQNNIL